MNCYAGYFAPMATQAWGRNTVSQIPWVAICMKAVIVENLW